MLSIRNKILMTAAAVGLLSAGGVAAVANAQDSTMPPQGEQQTNVTDQKLREFVAAQAAVSQVQAQFQNQAANITSQSQMAALQQQANEQMVQTIQQTDLSVQEYNQISNAVQADPKVQKRYMELVQ